MLAASGIYQDISHPMHTPSLLIAASIAILVSLLGWFSRALTRQGAVAAAVIGFLVLSGTGWAGGAALGVFFVGASLVSRMTEGRNPVGFEAKGNQRDPAQVMANGGSALVGGILGFHDPLLGLWVVTTSLAAAGADTWATSIGALSRHDPVLVHNGKRVPPGTSGAVSVVGTLGGLLGAGLTAGVAALAARDLSMLAWGTMIGTCGMLADSFLGATLQARFRCRKCDVPTERVVHHCELAAEHVGGIRWLNNDVVNAIATALAGLAGLAAGYSLGVSSF